ncbi:MAG: hypothetical protein JWP87_5352, partial [Labilithrix sp.]|nr:hypothetical protein [Labilithrix sp.]
MRASCFVVGCLAAAGLVPSLAASAAADSVDATRYEILERSHVVELKVDRGFATLVVQRKVANTGPKSDQATFHLDLPDTAVATRLRTAGVDAKGQPIWFEGELMEAEAAAKKYEELTGIGGYYPKDPALLSWRHQGLLALQVFPVPAQSTKTVEYTLKMPLAYDHGAYRVELPPMGTDALAASVRVSAAHPEDSVIVNGIAASSQGAITARAEKSITIELRPRGVPTIDTALASVPIGEGKHLVRGRIAAAPHLAEAPFGAHVVVLFDGSRSHHSAEAGLVAVRAYLGSMPGATVDFLTFDREVRSPLGRSLPVASALSKLAAFRLERRNGSRIDDALARADTILQASPASARRVVVVTDTLTRSALTPEQLGSASWKSGAVVHLAMVADGAASAVRNDDSPWAALPRRTGGLFWTANAPSQIDTTTRNVFEEWARPKRIDKLTVKGLTGGVVESDVLDEGEGIDHFEIAESATSRVQIDGELWSKPIHVTGAPTAEQGKLASALVFGSPLWNQLAESEQMKLALLGGAVSPVTSYLAIEPGVRPSNEGLDWGTIGHGGGTGVGQAWGNGSGRLFGSGGAAVVDKDAWLRTQLAKASHLCAPLAESASASLESTLDEVVDVGAVELSPTRDTKSEACIREEL